MELKTIEQIKNEVAVKNNFTDWASTMHLIGRPSIVLMMEEVAKEYAKQMCEKQREICSEQFSISFIPGLVGAQKVKILDKESILNAPLATDTI